MGHTSFQLDRRRFLQAGLLAAGALALSPAYLRRAFAAGPITIGDGPYGPLGAFDANGIALPAGFTSREIARGATSVSGSVTPYVWHLGTDGQATYSTLGPGGGPDGGWILVANSEVPVPGGAGASGVEFGPDGAVERAYRVLEGTTANCAGGPAPWGKWLSCEEYEEGRVWECDPTGATPGIPRPEMGVFSHEAVCVDPDEERLYLTEDEGDGCLYRFTPAVYPDLSSGLLECAIVDGAGQVTWAEVPEPQGGAANPTRGQVAAAAHFDGGEGTWFDSGIVYFTTKGDNRVWAYNTVTSAIEVIYDAAAVGPDAPLSGVDNITVSQFGDIYVCEDGRDHDICLITPDFEISRFLKLDPTVHAGPPAGTPFEDNETVGVVFSPSGNRMYFGAQRSFGIGGNEEFPAGVVYEVTGPFRLPPGGGGGLGPGGGVPGTVNPTATDASGPAMRVRARRRKGIPSYLRHGIPLKLELDEPAGVKAVLRAAVREDRDKRSLATIGRVATSVAVSGKVGLRLEPTARAERILTGRRRAAAILTVEATDAAGNKTTSRRRLVLHEPERD